MDHSRPRGSMGASLALRSSQGGVLVGPASGHLKAGFCALRQEGQGKDRGSVMATSSPRGAGTGLRMNGTVLRVGHTVPRLLGLILDSPTTASCKGVRCPRSPRRPRWITKEAGQAEAGHSLFTSHRMSFSGGAAKRRYSRIVSMPYWLTTCSGSSPLCLDLLIFSQLTSSFSLVFP